MIIDLDAHQGNGHERDFLKDPNTYIVDAYHHGIYPGDTLARDAIKKDIKIKPETYDEAYLESLLQIESCIIEFKPSFILYNAGTDIMHGDPLSGLGISHETIVKRDEMMFEFALRHKVPILMVLSGGYQKKNAPCIADSIENLVKRFDLGDSGLKRD